MGKQKSKDRKKAKKDKKKNSNTTSSANYVSINQNEDTAGLVNGHDEIDKGKILKSRSIDQEFNPVVEEFKENVGQGDFNPIRTNLENNRSDQDVLISNEINIDVQGITKITPKNLINHEELRKLQETSNEDMIEETKMDQDPEDGEFYPVYVENNFHVLNSLVNGAFPFKTIENGLDLYWIDTVHNGFNDLKLDWNPEEYAMRTSTNFSSFSLAQENLNAVGTIDFIGDASCFEEIFSSSLRNEALSFVLHGIGNSVLIDRLDLLTLLCDRKQSFAFKESDEFAQVIRDLITENEVEKVKCNRSTLMDIMNEQMTWKAFYSCLDFDAVDTTHINGKTGTRNKRVRKSDELSEIDLSGAGTKFLRNGIWDFLSYEFLIGTQVPVFEAKIDEPIEDELSSSSTRITLGVNMVEEQIDEEYPISAEQGIHMWFNNLLLKAEKSYVCHYSKDNIVQRDEFVPTGFLPKRARFDGCGAIATFKQILNGIKSFVRNPGNTYWLYRAPGQDLFVIYDVTEILRRKKLELEPVIKTKTDEDVTSSQESKRKKKKHKEANVEMLVDSEPFLKAYGTLLYKMCMANGNLYHSRTFVGMLNFLMDLFPSKHYPIVNLSLRLRYLDSRIGTDPLYNPTLKVLNGSKIPELNFEFLWDYVSIRGDFRKFKFEAEDVPYPKEAIYQYEELCKYIEPESFWNIIDPEYIANSGVPWADPSETMVLVSSVVDVCDYAFQPLYLDNEITPPRVVRRILQEHGRLKIIYPSSSAYMLAAVFSFSGRITSNDALNFEISRFENGGYKDCFIAENPLKVLEKSVSNNSEKKKTYHHYNSNRISAEEEFQHAHLPFENALKCLTELKIASVNTSIGCLPDPLSWFGLCEVHVLMRVVASCSVILEEATKLSKTAKCKKNEMTSTLDYLRQQFYDAVARFFLILCGLCLYGGNGRLVMARHCAVLAEFCNNEFGRRSSNINCAAKFYSWSSAWDILRLKNACYIWNPPKNAGDEFEKAVKKYFKFFKEFRDLIFKNRNPFPSKEWKNYSLFPSNAEVVVKEEEKFIRTNFSTEEKECLSIAIRGRKEAGSEIMFNVLAVGFNQSPNERNRIMDSLSCGNFSEEVKVNRELSISKSLFC